MAKDLLDRGQPSEALAVLEQAADIPPENLEIRYLAAEAQFASGQGQASVNSFQALVREYPGIGELHRRYGDVLTALGKPTAAQIEHRKALGLVPRYQSVPPEMYYIFFAATRRSDFECIRGFGDMWSFFESIPASSLREFFLHLFPYAVTLEDNRRMVSLNRKWAAALEAAAAQTPLLAPLPATYAGGPIRIGFLASLCAGNNVSKFMLPVFDALRAQGGCEIAYFSTIGSIAGDSVQDQIKRFTDIFEDVSQLDGRSVAQRIRQSGCHVAIDCDGYARWSKTEALCYRPALLQVSMINWPGTLGISAIDAIVVDRYSNPPVAGTLIESSLVLDGNIGPQIHPEQLAMEPPFTKNGFITFGTQSTPYKLTPALVSLWSEVLREVGDSQFLIVRPECENAAFVDNVQREFRRHSVSSERLRFIDNSTTGKTHLSFYNEMDIVLDSVPLNGGTTTFEALWMGTPVITYAGPGLHQRISHTILCGLGLDDLSGSNSADYIEHAVALSGNRERIRHLKATLRPRIESSSMMDAGQIAAQLKQLLIDRLIG